MCHVHVGWTFIQIFLWAVFEIWTMNNAMWYLISKTSDINIMIDICLRCLINSMIVFLFFKSDHNMTWLCTQGSQLHNYINLLCILFKLLKFDSWSLFAPCKALLLKLFQTFYKYDKFEHWIIEGKFCNGYTGWHSDNGRDKNKLC